MIIGREFWFSMGHTLHNYSGKCANLHGHNYRLIVEVERDHLNRESMVMDFGELKVMLVQYNPTAEMIAEAIKLRIYTKMHTASLSKITLWETENSYAEV